VSFDHPIVWDDQKVARLWNYYAKTPPYSGSYFSKAFGQGILRKSALPLAAGLNVLDFGCGPGFIWDHLVRLRANWRYVGLDFSQGSISTLTKKASGHSLFAGGLHIERLPTPFPNAEFDAVLLVEVLEHLNEDYLAETLREARRLLKTKGFLLITTPNEEDLSSATKYCPECGAIFHEWQHVRSWSITSLRSCMDSYGFDEKFSLALDLAETNLLRWSIQRARRLLRGNRKRPHILAVFEKRP
jgi:SAM-dependent methyltransferase